MSMKRWKAVEVVVNNAPNEWHIVTGNWGEPSIAVVNTKENAILLATAPELLGVLQLAIATIQRLTKDHGHGFTSTRGTCDAISRVIAKAEGRVS